MELEGSVALVTGANRGLGAALTRALVAAGAAKVYAASRTPFVPDLPGVVNVPLDVADPASVAALAERLGDVTLVVNNAGTLLPVDLAAPSAADAVQANLDVNTFGPLRVTAAFAPTLAANGGGAVVNVLSVLSWVVLAPAAAGYSMSKAAGWALTNAQRLQLRGQGTQVLAVHVGYMDTDMSADAQGPKLSPDDAAAQILQALADGRDEVLLDDVTRSVKAALAHEPAALYPV